MAAIADSTIPYPFLLLLLLPPFFLLFSTLPLLLVWREADE
jgi:hypothetical protein